MHRAADARELAEGLLAKPLPRRWAHVQGVAAKARRAGPVVGDDAELLEVAAWLHDIGYAPDLAHAGFHPLDGARYLRDTVHADALLCGLVAFHTGAIHEARERGLDTELTGEFVAAPPLLTHAITYCDITTSPDGEHIDVRERLADIANRYGPDHIVNRSVTKASPSLLESVHEIESRLRS